MCTENLIRIDCVTESPNVNGDDRALLPLPDPVRLAVQVDDVKVFEALGLERASLRGASSRVVHAIECEGEEGLLRLAGNLKDWAAELGLTVLWLLPTLAILVGIIEAVRLNRKQREARRRHILGEPETTSSAADGDQSSSESKISYE